MSIFTVVWPLVAVLVLALLAVAVLQTRITRRFTAPASTRLETSPLVVAASIEPPTAVPALADTPA